MQSSLPAGWLAFTGREFEPSGSLQKVSDHTLVPLFWIYPGATYRGFSPVRLEGWLSKRRLPGLSAGLSLLPACAVRRQFASALRAPRRLNGCSALCRAADLIAHRRGGSLLLRPRGPRSENRHVFAGAADMTCSVMTLKPASVHGPNEVTIATSVASRPRAIKMRPICGLLWRASNVYQRPPR